MPSGSHGGSSGSHGGFRGGGGSSFGGGGFRRSGSSGHVTPRGPRHIRWFGGRTIIISTGRQNLLSFIAFFVVCCIMCAVAGFSSASTTKSDLVMIEEEQRYYLSMVSDAEADPDLQTTGKVTGVFYKQEYEKYYITYEFYSGSATYSGYTFSIYTLESAPKKGTEILLAIDDEVIDSSTDSVPMDYKNYTLEDDGEYMMLKERLSYNRAIGFGGIAGVILLVGGAVLVVATAKKKEAEEKAETEKKEEEKQQEEERKKYCQYCGSKVNPEDVTCGQCGASLK